MDEESPAKYPRYKGFSLLKPPENALSSSQILDDRSGDEIFQYTKNRFLKAIEAAPIKSDDQIVLSWNLEREEFETSQFHPSKVMYKVTSKELQRVK